MRARCPRAELPSWLLSYLSLDLLPATHEAPLISAVLHTFPFNHHLRPNVHDHDSSYRHSFMIIMITLLEITAFDLLPLAGALYVTMCRYPSVQRSILLFHSAQRYSVTTVTLDR